MRDCQTFTCRRRPPRLKRPAVWLIDGKPTCNVCYLNWIDTHDVDQAKIVRLYDDEDLYDDRQRRRRNPPPPTQTPLIA